MTNQTGAGATSDDLRHTAAVAADYNQLQGLTTATTGLGLAVWALGGSFAGPIIIAVGVSITVTWYEKRYGKVRQRGALRSSIGMILLAVLAVLAAFAADGVLGPPGPIFPSLAGGPGTFPLLLPLVGAVCLAISYKVAYRHVGVTWIHWAVAGLLALSAFLPLLGLATLGASTGVLLLGVALVVVGIVDHVRLVTTMKPVPRD